MCTDFHFLYWEVFVPVLWFSTLPLIKRYISMPAVSCRGFFAFYKETVRKFNPLRINFEMTSLSGLLVTMNPAKMISPSLIWWSCFLLLKAPHAGGKLHQCIHAVFFHCYLIRKSNTLFSRRMSSTVPKKAPRFENKQLKKTLKFNVL